MTQRTLHRTVAVLALSAAGLLLPGPASHAAAPQESPEERRSERILFQDEVYPYEVFAPRGYRTRPAGPVVVLLHGLGGSGRSFIATWQDVAAEHGVLLVAPTLAYNAQLEPLVPTLLRAIVAQVKKTWPCDAHRVYLFGHSAGGVTAFDAAMLDSDVFAAAAVHAAAIFPGYDWILARAKRKIPIALN